VRLRRGALSRARFVGLLELVSGVWTLIVAFVVADALSGEPQNWGGPGGVAFLGALVAAVLAVRVAVATEYLEADHIGLRWRTLFRRHAIPWERVASVEFGPMNLFPQLFAEEVIVVQAKDGARWRVRASVWSGERASAWARSTARTWFSRDG
jgi:hypothetical protein